MNDKCWYCGGQLCWDNDFDLFDVYPELKGECDGGIVTYLHCTECGSTIEYKLIEELKKDE